MTESWLEIPGFPRYRVSDMGRVESIKTGRILRPSQNQQGMLKVNLVEDGEVHTRTVNHLVAKAFLEKSSRPDFSSLIHLDGNKSNCEVSNLAWRPKYFTLKYHQQFLASVFDHPTGPIRDLKTGEEYESMQDAVVKNGLLLSDIISAIHARTYVWPTYQEFGLIEV